MELKTFLPLFAAFVLGGCRAAQVLTSDTVATDSTSQERVERVITSTVSADGRTTTVRELETRTSRARQQARQSHVAPAPPKPAKAAKPRAAWYDRLARRIAAFTILAVAGGIYLKFFSPFHLL